MNRKLLLISNDGATGKFLPGVAIDVKNYLSFFKAPFGGAWSKDEIAEFANTTKDELLLYINFVKHVQHVDYWLIVFTGHGYAIKSNNNTDTVLELSQGNEITLSEIRNLTINSPCMVIADCCRVVYPVESLQDLCESFSEDFIKRLDADKCRTTYNRTLESLHNGLYCGLATSLNEKAGDDEVLGGLYSFSLLKTARESIKSMLVDGNIVSSFHDIHQVAKKETTKLKSDQHPICRTNTINIPFVVIG